MMANANLPGKRKIVKRHKPKTISSVHNRAFWCFPNVAVYHSHSIKTSIKRRYVIFGGVGHTTVIAIRSQPSFSLCVVLGAAILRYPFVFFARANPGRQREDSVSLCGRVNI